MAEKCRSIRLVGAIAPQVLTNIPVATTFLWKNMNTVFGVLLIIGGLAACIFFRIILQDKFPKISSLLFRRHFLYESLDDEPEAFSPPLTHEDSKALEEAEGILKARFGALKIGPFNARITQRIVTPPSYKVANSMVIGTCFTIDILPVKQFSFEITFPETFLRKPSPDKFRDTLQMTCGQPELKVFLNSEEFLSSLYVLNSIAPGSVQGIGDTFSIYLFTPIGDEDLLTSFVSECENIFRKYARHLQLNVLEWRMNAADYDWWSDGEIPSTGASVSVDALAIDAAASQS